MPRVVDAVFRQRKFFLACCFALTGMIALFIGKLGGGEFIALAGTVLGLYGAANVIEKRDAEAYTLEEKLNS